MIVGLLFRLPIYILPYVMYSLETALDEVAKKVVEGSLLGTAIASAAIGLFLPTMKPSWTSPQGWKQGVDRGASALSFTGFLGTLIVWHSLVAENLGGKAHHWMDAMQFWSLDAGASVATALYGCAVFLNEVKAAVEK